MHIEPSTHEQSHSAKVYTYEADFDVSGDTIHWHAQVRQGEEPPREIHGEIPITSPALPAYAEKAVRDAIVQGIDHLVSVCSPSRHLRASKRKREPQRRSRISPTSGASTTTRRCKAKATTPPHGATTRRNSSS